MKTKNLLFFVVCLILGLNIKAQDNYQLVTDLSQIQNGSTIIFAARHDSLSATSYYAMANVAAGKPQGTLFTSTTTDGVEVLPPEIADNEQNFSWTVGMSGNNYTFINSDGDMIGYGNSGTDFVKNGTNSTWSISVSTSGSGTSVPNHNAFVITNVGASNRSFAFRKFNNDAAYEKFAPYSNSDSNMGGTIYFFYIDIFVKSSEVTPVVSLPKFSPEGGDYTTTQNVSITSETAGATIYYTLDGSTPSDESSVYSQPIEVASTTTIKAIAKKEGMTNSGVASATYNIIEEVTVSFYSNGILQETKTVASGEEIGELPVATAPDGFTFNGWTENEIQGAMNTSPSMITASMEVESDLSLYAVFSVSNSNCVEYDIDEFNQLDVAVITISKEGKYYAMSQVKGGSGQPTACEVSVSNSKIVGSVTDDLKWNIAYNNGNMIIHPNADSENWLYCTSGNNNNALRIGTNTDNNIFELKTVEIEEEVYPNYLYNVTTERFVGAYYDDGVAIDWRAYKLTASGAFPTNIKNQTYHFFKYEGISYYCTNVEIPQAQTITTNTTWENVSIANKIIVGKGVTLTLNGAAACIDADNLIIEDGAQLIHNNYGLMATIEKEVEGYGSTNEGWYTICSPLKGNVVASSVEGLMPTSGNYDLYRYDEPTSVWQNIKDSNNNFTTLDSGRGYLYANEYDATLSFVGELNNEVVSFDLLKTDNISLSGFNLIGNPFSHNIYKGKGAAIDNDDLASGYYVLSNDGAWSAKVSNDEPITPSQSILVKTTKAGILEIKKTNVQPSQKSETGILTVTVENDDYEDRAFVMFDETTGLEKINHQNEDVPMIYVSLDEANYAVATVDEETQEIPLSFRAMTMGEYKIKVSSNKKQFDYIFLVDNQTGEVTNMLTDEYSFMATTNDNPERFTIKLYNVESVEESLMTESFVYVNNDEIMINNVMGEAVVEVFDVMGRCVLKKESSNEKTYVLSSTTMFDDAIYIIRLIDDNGIRTQKLLIEK